jgi:hypothetical protein
MRYRNITTYRLRSNGLRERLYELLAPGGWVRLDVLAIKCKGIISVRLAARRGSKYGKRPMTDAVIWSGYRMIVRASLKPLVGRRGVRRRDTWIDEYQMADPAAWGWPGKGTTPTHNAVTVGGRTFHVLFPDLLRPLTAEERAGLREDISRRGVITPVVVDQDNGIIDGINRLTLAAELGLDAGAIPVDVRRGLTPSQKRDLAVALNEHRWHLSVEDLQRLRQERLRRVAEKRREGKSTR